MNKLKRFAKEKLQQVIDKWLSLPAEGYNSLDSGSYRYFAPLSWEEHEKIYCKDLIEPPDLHDIYDDRVNSYSEGEKIIENYEMSSGSGGLRTVKYQNKYYIVYCDSLEQEKKYKIN